jgi:iron complex transport system ATP-binding protein
MTPETVIQDEPCKFNFKGSFASLFKDDNISFDAAKENL